MLLAATLHFTRAPIKICFFDGFLEKTLISLRAISINLLKILTLPCPLTLMKVSVVM